MSQRPSSLHQPSVSVAGAYSAVNSTALRHKTPGRILINKIGKQPFGTGGCKLSYRLRHGAPTRSERKPVAWPSLIKPKSSLELPSNLQQNISSSKWQLKISTQWWWSTLHLINEPGKAKLFQVNMTSVAFLWSIHNCGKVVLFTWYGSSVWPSLSINYAIL